MFSKVFLTRLSEEAITAFVATFAVTAASGASLSGSALASAAVAGARSALGVVGRLFGPDRDRPTVK